MTLGRLTAILAATAVGAWSLPLSAQDRSGPNLGALASDAGPGGVATVGLAQELYAFGSANGDALTVLAAAKLAASVDIAASEPGSLDSGRIAFADDQDGSARRTGVVVGPPATPAPVPTDGTPRDVAKATFFDAASDDEGNATGPATASEMFAKAKALAGDDEALLGLIDDAMAEGSRGRIGGAVEWVSRLPAGQTDVWEVAYYGNSYAEVAVVGDGDANLDVAVTDENGNVICYEVSGSDKLYCDWTPAWDGYFYVTVQNLGGSRNSYHLLTN